MLMGVEVVAAAKDRSVFAWRLRQARERLGISQIELGRRAGLDPSVASPRINQYEQGQHVPHHATARRLAEVLGVPTAYLFAEDEQLAKLLLLWSEMSPAERKKLLKTVEASRKPCAQLRLCKSRLMAS
jgi:transcriptional regulator with XRE-family HTH domain